MCTDPRVKHAPGARRRAVELFDLSGRLARSFRSQGYRESMTVDISGARERGAAGHGRQVREVHI